MSRPRVRINSKDMRGRKEHYEDTTFRYDLYLDFIPACVDSDPEFTQKMRTNDLERCLNAKRSLNRFLKEKEDKSGKLALINQKLRRMLSMEN